MQFQTVFDSVCRCFGHTPTSPTSPVGPSSANPQPVSTSNSQSSNVKRRTNRLELKDKEWDALFDDGKAADGGEGDSKPSKTRNKQDSDLEYAKAVAKAKLAANPSRHRSKRKRSGKSRDDIFRNKQPPVQANSAASAQQNTLSRLLNPSVALCFATPVRGTEEEVDENVLRSTDNSDTNTLNTCEDTITSTLYFDSKYSHVVETRPPMPLFSQFKIGHQKDEIRTIVATDSHSSLKILRLLQDVQENQPTKVGEMEDSSTDSDAGNQALRPDTSQKFVDHPMEDVPDVKAASSSTSSSRNTAPTSR